jgi:hypothetical protein
MEGIGSDRVVADTRNEAKKRVARGKEGGPMTIRADEVLNGKMRPKSQVINTEKGLKAARQATGIVMTDKMLIGDAEVVVILKVLVPAAVLVEDEKIEGLNGETDEQNLD